MTIQPAKPTLSSPAARAMLDVLADGLWHTSLALWAAGARAEMREDPEGAMVRGESLRTRMLRGKHVEPEEIALLGATEAARLSLALAGRKSLVNRFEDRHRMFPMVAEQWRADNPDLHYPDVRVLCDEIPEPELWLYAPLRLRDIIHFRPSDDIDTARLRQRLGRTAGKDMTVTDNGEGLIRVECNDASMLKDEVIAFCKAAKVTPKALRVEKDARRRDIEKLPQRYRDDLIAHYGYKAGAMLIRKKNQVADSLRVVDNDDLRQYGNLWTIEAVSRYDENTGVPFEAFIVGQINRRITDLAREKWGRSGTDAERQYRQSVETFAAQNGYEPSVADLAEATGRTVAEVAEQRRIAEQIGAVRDTRTLTSDASGAMFAPEYEQSDDSDDVDQGVLNRERETMLSRALTQAGGGDEPNALGWAAVYFATWMELDEKTTADLLGVDVVAVTKSKITMRDAMHARLTELMGA